MFCETGVITGTLDGSASVDGPYDVIITATDPDGETVSVTFVWTIDNVAPVIIAPLDPEELTTADEVEIRVADVVDDPDGDSLTFTAENLPDGLTIDPDTGVITGTPQEEGLFTVVITIDDGEGGQVQTSLALDVLQTGFILPDMPFSRVVDLDRVGPYEGLNAAPIALRDFFADRSIINALFDTLEPRETGLSELELSAYLGAVLAVKVPGVDHDCGYLMVETLAMDHIVNVQLMSSLEAFCDISVTSWDVTLANGRSLPDWIDRSGNLLQIQPQPGQDNVELRVRAVLDNGRTVVMRGEIDLGTAQITEIGRASASLSSFADQLAAETAEFTPEQDELVKALA